MFRKNLFVISSIPARYFWNSVVTLSGDTE